MFIKDKEIKYVITIKAIRFRTSDEQIDISGPNDNLLNLVCTWLVNSYYGDWLLRLLFSNLYTFLVSKVTAVNRPGRHG